MRESGREKGGERGEREVGSVGWTERKGGAEGGHEREKGKRKSEVDMYLGHLSPFEATQSGPLRDPTGSQSVL